MYVEMSCKSGETTSDSGFIDFKSCYRGIFRKYNIPSSPAVFVYESVFRHVDMLCHDAVSKGSNQITH